VRVTASAIMMFKGMIFHKKTTSKRRFYLLILLIASLAISAEH